jgi:hypothetical protein
MFLLSIAVILQVETHKNRKDCFYPVTRGLFTTFGSFKWDVLRMVLGFHQGENFFKRTFLSGFNKLMPGRFRNITGPEKDEIELSNLEKPTIQAVEDAATEAKESINSILNPYNDKSPFEYRNHFAENSEEHYVSEKHEFETRPSEPKAASVYENEKASSPQPHSEVRENEAHKEANAKQHEHTQKEKSSHPETESHPSREHVKSEELKPEAFKLNSRERAFAVRINLLQQCIRNEKASLERRTREIANQEAMQKIELQALESKMLPVFLSQFEADLEVLVKNLLKSSTAKNFSMDDLISQSSALFNQRGSQLSSIQSQYVALNKTCPFNLSDMLNQLEGFRKEFLPSLDSKKNNLNKEY